MKKCIVILAMLLGNLLIASEATSTIPEENLRIARFEVRHHPWCYLDSKNNVIALRFQLDFLFNGKEYYTSPITEKDVETIGLDELYKFSQNVDPTLRQEVTDFFKEKNLTSFSITHTRIGISVRLN